MDNLSKYIEVVRCKECINSKETPCKTVFRCNREVPDAIIGSRPLRIPVDENDFL